MRSLFPLFIAALLVLALVPQPLRAQLADWGDAPEGVTAYPSTGVTGAFPTCLTIPIGAYITHGTVPPQWTFFGPMEDYEPEGNAGNCTNTPPFPPYDLDECFQDGDAGLTRPQPYTIVGGTVVPCPNSTGTPLQDTCQFAVWGTNIDILVVNSGNPNAPGYINVLFDWNQNGIWGDVDTCYIGGVPGLVPEHVLTNLYLPMGYAGGLSGLLPPGSGFVVGSNRGYVWARFMVSEAQVPPLWAGDGVYEGGESEDYLIEINQIPTPEPDYGDAPESQVAYPWTGTIGQFPTCVNIGPSGWVDHIPGGQAWLGLLVDGESDGNAGNCAVTPPFPPYDMDECFQDGDAGLIMPPSYTIDGANNVVPCVPGSIGALGATCSTAVWGTDIDILVTNNSSVGMYLNFLADWNQDGVWGGQAACPGGPVSEHVLVDFAIPPGFSQPLSFLGPAPFVIGPDTGYVWTRFTISPVPVGSGWDGNGMFDDGESEDYLLRVADPLAGVDVGYERPRFHLYAGEPNPSTGGTSIRYEMLYSRRVKMAVYDASGRQVKILFDTVRPAGEHEAFWDGTDFKGDPVASGIYFCRMESGTFVETQRLALIR
jgi:hypothetical protein